MKQIVIATIFIILSPIYCFASVKITEIMYDLEGTDTDREWVEIYNDGDVVDLSTWKFFEGNTNHGLVLSQGSSTLENGAYAVIVQNAASFLIDWPSYTGTVFDSSFSLGNETGETIDIKDSALNIVDEATYSSESGASGDGNSLVGSGTSWSPGNPTPGAGNSASDGEGSATTVATTNENIQLDEEGDLVMQQTNWSIDITSPSYISVGNDADFNATVYDIYFQKYYTGHLFWNMGDGTVYEGDLLFNINHTYTYPGDYVIYIEYYKPGATEPKTSVRKTATVVDTNIDITTVVRDGYLIDTKITNNGSREVDLTGWTLSSGGKTYTIPKNTIVLPKKTLVIPSKNTSFVGNSSTIVTISSYGSYGSPIFASTNSKSSPSKKYASNTSKNTSSEKTDFVNEVENERNFLEEKNINTNDLTANVGNAPIDKSTLAIFGFIGLLVLSCASILYIRGNKKESEPKTNNFSAEDFELLE